MTPKRIAIVFALVLCLGAAARCAAQTYTMIMPTPKGLSMGSMDALLKDMGKAIEKKTGIKVNVVNLEFDYLDTPVEDTLAKMKAGKVDLAMVFGIDYVRYAANNKINAVPLFAISMFGRSSYDVCLFTRKADNIKSAKDLKGKVWGGVKTKNARYIMHLDGIQTPMSGFFSKLVYMPEENVVTLLDALLDKKIDVFTVPNYQVNMTRNTNKKYNQVADVSCREYEHNWFIVYNKDTMSKENAAKIKEAFMAAHKDPQFAQFKFLLTAVKGRFVGMEIKDLANTVKIVKYLQKYKWDQEELAFIKKNFKR
jgi:ABC-type phosphate/phosphonate transport system substrate-binding protein